MTLPDLLHALNSASIRLTYAGQGQLSLRPATAVTPEISAAVSEHKPILLALLAKEEMNERKDIAHEGCHTLTELAQDLERAIAEFDAVLAADGWSIAKGEELAKKAVELNDNFPNTEEQRRAGDRFDQAYIEQDGPGLVKAVKAFAKQAKNLELFGTTQCNDGPYRQRR